MSSTAPGPRPREVTVGGWAVPIASAILVVAVFDRMAGLQSVATRDALTTALTAGWAKDLGITVDDAISMIRVVLFVSGTAAAVTGVLGIFALQRHASARIALTVAAVPVVLTAPVVGGLLGIAVGVGAGMMWTRPARDWFAGRPPAPREVARPEPARTQPTPPEWRPHDRDDPPPAAQQPPQPPPPIHGWGQAPGPVPPAYPAPYPPTHPVPQPAPHPASYPPESYPPESYVPAPYPQASYPQGSWAAFPADGGRMPTQVRVACILTWVFSLLTGGVYLLLILAIAVDRGGMVELLRDNPSVQDTSLTDDQLVAVLIAVSAVILVWCLAAALLAFLTWRRHVAAWVILLVCVGAAGVAEIFALPFSLLHLAAGVTTFVLLLRAPVRAWIRGEPRRQPPTWPGAAPAWPQPSAPQPPAQQPLTPQSPTQQPPSAEDHPVQPPGKPPVW